MSLNFFKAQGTKDFKQIYEYTIDAFSETPDFKWTLDEIKKEVSEGWELYGATNEEDDIVAAVFLRIEKESMLTKNTGLQILHQGSGYNHEIKEFFEQKAKENKLKKIFHYCRIDNFRMYSLNESHGYKKTGNSLSEGQIVEWVKNLK